MPNKYYPTDARLEHRAVAQAAVTASAVIDTIDQRAAMRTDFTTIIGLEAIKISANNELYQFVVEVSNDDFTTVEVAAVKDFGATEVRQSGAPDSAAADQHEIEWNTEVNGVVYDKARLNLIIAGTSPTITFHARSTVR
jgi:hypothetical protein|tara:strand:- start:20201 stop:20617 length:417 start_codon:yes stop_codon:yes gene_type:complete